MHLTVVVLPVPKLEASPPCCGATDLSAALSKALTDACPGITVHVLGEPGANQPGASPPAALLLLGDATALLARPALLTQLSTTPAGLIGPPPTDDEGARLAAAGLCSWWPESVARDGASLAALLAFLQAQHAARLDARQAAEREITQLRRQIDERKWIDRAKGVLMSARGIAEQEAFVLLRGAAMHANLRLGELSRAVAEAAQWAEALNRAGQLRMLSQRILRLWAQRLAGIEPASARSTQKAVADRLGDNLRVLQRLDVATAPELATALATVAADGSRLLRQLDERPAAALLAQADAAAEALLLSAERLASALEQRGGRQALHIVNLCGRQRMRVQRVAKEAVLAALLGDAGRAAALPALLQDFEHTLGELEGAPLSTPTIRSALTTTRDEWLRLLRSLRELNTGSGRARPLEAQIALVQASDRLLELFEALTDAYEHSLQVIMA